MEKTTEEKLATIKIINKQIDELQNNIDTLPKDVECTIVIKADEFKLRGILFEFFVAEKHRLIATAKELMK